MTNFTHTALIDDLVADLRPARAVRSWHGIALVIGAAVTLSMIVVAMFGARKDLAAGAPHWIFLVRSGALLLIGMATVQAAAAAAHPGIGRKTGWGWALAASAMLPVCSVVMAVSNPIPLASLWSSTVPWCLATSLLSACLIGGAMGLWLRRGAVTEPRLTGMLVGLCAGAFGTFAYNLYCPSDSIQFAALWYSLTVAISALAGRMLLPGLWRW